jgi:hypothetical protein
MADPLPMQRDKVTRKRIGMPSFSWYIGTKLP